MAYFNHAFTKVFLGTQKSGGGAGQNPNTNLTDGFVTTSGISTVELAGPTFGPGSFGFFNPKTGYQSVDISGITGAGACCPLVLASAALYQNDKIGKFHGGYQESNKSKIINPKYIRAFYRVDPCELEQNIIHIGNTPFVSAGILTGTITGGATYDDGTYTNVELIGGSGTGALATVVVAAGVVTSVVFTNPGINYTVGDVLTFPVGTIGAGDGNADFTVDTVSGAANACTSEFYCDETYYLRLDIKGAPVLKFAQRNIYGTLDAYTGCCPAGAPSPVLVDSTLVMIEWAKQLIKNEILNPFVKPVVITELGVVLATEAAMDAYVSPGHIVGATAGLILYGAFIETKFGDCTFQTSDGYEKEPVKIYASMVDLEGEPCKFEGICINEECPGRQGQGFGETVLRDLILSESYLQNFFNTDLRIREITQGNNITAAIDRSKLYTRYYILHSVPRYNNPTGVFDNDQYSLEVITDGANTAFEDFMEEWLDNCTDCVSLEVHNCISSCNPVLSMP
jgi:hypothetical protein